MACVRILKNDTPCVLEKQFGYNMLNFVSLYMEAKEIMAKVL